MNTGRAARPSRVYPRTRPGLGQGRAGLGGDLVDDERLAGPYLAALDSLHRRGARATVQQLVAGEPPVLSEGTGH